MFNPYGIGVNVIAECAPEDYRTSINPSPGGGLSSIIHNLHFSAFSAGITSAHSAHKKSGHTSSTYPRIPIDARALN